MSQLPNPPPPQTPPISYPSPPMRFARLPHAEGRVAGVLVMVVAGLLSLFGSCVGTAIWMIPDNLISDMIQKEGLVIPPDAGFSAVQLARISATLVAIGIFALGIVLFILAVFIRRGGKASAVGAIVIMGLVLLFLAVKFIVGAFMLISNPDVIVDLLMCCAVGALCVATIRKLLAAYRAGSAADASTMQAYYWMMQQQQPPAGYGYGYGYPAPPMGAAPISAVPPTIPLPPPPRDPSSQTP